MNVFHFLELVLDAGLASSASRAVAREPLQVLEGLGLAGGHQMLDDLVGHALAFAEDLRDGSSVRVVHAALLEIVVNCGAKGLVAQVLSTLQGMSSLTNPSQNYGEQIFMRLGTTNEYLLAMKKAVEGIRAEFALKLDLMNSHLSKL